MYGFDFDKVVYRGIKVTKHKNFISELIGIDSEAYPSGKPFLFATSLGDFFELKDIPNCFFTRKYRGKHFATWNLKYDSGALLYDLPSLAKDQLRLTGQVTHEGYTYRYIPDKCLRIAKGKNAVRFWDIMPFFKSSLDAAAQKHLHKKKVGLDTNTFLEEFVDHHLCDIQFYCLTDAKLTSELGAFLLRYMADFGVYPSNLYSIASVSFRYFQQNCDIVNVFRFWRDHKDLLRFACEAYTGGKFEVTQKGRFEAYEFDINSCYPNEIRNLVDITSARVFHTPTYQSKATYGFLRVHIHAMPPVYHPIAIKQGVLNTYPCGCFDRTITKAEYDYILTLGAQIEIEDAWWLFPRSKIYPYRKVVDNLYKRKSELKDKDAMGYNLVKIMLNGFYGKMVQMIKQTEGTLKAGIGWNPIYASVITANGRIRMSQIQNTYQDECLCVHTDSVLLTKPHLLDKCSTRIGDWTLDGEGDTLIIGCGIYQIGDKVRIRGFVYDNKVNLKLLLAQSPGAKKIKLPSFTIQSWRLACHRGKFDEVNLPINSTKVLDLNCDRKRIWLEDATSDILLSRSIKSSPDLLLQGVKKKW